jgi:hypothetical protein
MARDIPTEPFEGEVEADGTWIGGYIRPKNARKEEDQRNPTKTKKNHWKVPYLGKKKLFVTAIRERGSNGRIRTWISEAEKDSPTLLKPVVTRKTVLHTDQASVYLDLAWDVAKHFRVNHSECFWTGEAHTNGVENFFAMLKRGVRGV